MTNANPSCGTGEGVTVACCPNPIPATLFATIDISEPLFCDCLNGQQVQLDWNGTRWVGERQLCGETLNIQVYCEDEDWLIDYSMNGCIDTGLPFITVECDPLFLQEAPAFNPACCGDPDGAEGLTITVTE